MPAKIRMQLSNINSISIPNKFVNNTPSSNLGKFNLGSMPMIKRLAGAKPCGSCGH